MKLILIIDMDKKQLTQIMAQHLGCLVVVKPWSFAFDPKLTLAPKHHLATIEAVSMEEIVTIRSAGLGLTNFTPDKLLLVKQPLKAISREDCLEVAKIAGYLTDRPDLGWDIVNEYMTTRWNTKAINWIHIYDFLHKKYDFPQAYLGGETMEKAGIAIYL